MQTAKQSLAGDITTAVKPIAGARRTARGRLMKEFDPSALKKVNGQRQLEEMEMRNPKAGSHTWIKFDLTSQR